MPNLMNLRIEYISKLSNDDYNVSGTNNRQLPRIEYVRGGITDDITMHIQSNYKSGDKINVSEIKNKFNLSQKKWVKARNKISSLITRCTNTFYVEEKIIKSK